MTAPRFRDERSERIYSRLLQLGRGPAAFFADAYEVIEGDVKLRTHSHVAGHLLREVISSLRDVLASATRVRGEDGSVRDSIRKIVRDLGLEVDGPVHQDWIELHDRLHGVAHRRNLRPPRPPDENLSKLWLGMLSVLDEVLDRFEARYADIYERLDRLSEVEQPTKAHFNEFVKTIPHTEMALKYFFSRLEHPAWFQGLRARGVFSEPPAPVEDPEAGMIQFPSWPATPYLKRVASAYSRDVADIIRGLGTENPRVQDDAIQILLELPVEYAVPLASRVRGWIPDLFGLDLLGGSVLTLAQRFVDNGEEAAAVALVEPLLATRVPREEARGQSPSWHRLEKVPYVLQKSATDLIDSLSRLMGTRVIDLIAAPLEDRIQAEAGVGSGSPLGTIDYSTIWLPSLRSQAPSRRGQMKGLLATHLHQILPALVERGGTVEAVVERLRVRETTLFRRIELSFLASACEPDDPLVAAALLDRRLLDASELRSEYSELLRHGYGLLPSPQKEEVLTWLRATDEDSGHDDDELRQIWAERSERNWLSVVEDHLDDSGASRLQKLIERHGEPEGWHRPSQAMAVSVGVSSPLNRHDMEGMSVEALQSFLNSWEPDPSPMGPSREGLRIALSQAISADAGRYSRAAKSLRGIRADFMRTVFEAMDHAVREGDTIHWGSVLELGRWVVDQPVQLLQTRAQNSSGPGGPDYSQARKALMGLLKRGLQSDGAPSLDLREAIWSLIEEVARDPDPTPEREKRMQESGRDSHGLGLNSVRPSAVAAAIQYLYWVNKHLSEGNEPVGMRAVPEFHRMLCERLDPETDPSSAVRAIVGRYIGYLLWFAPNWVEEHRNLLFPVDPKVIILRQTTFDGFLRFGRHSVESVELLSEEYFYAITRIRGPGVLEGDRGSTGKKLGERLMSLYWSGAITLDSEPNLLESFVATAPAELRGQAIRFVGWSLNRTERPVDEKPLILLEQFWDWRTQVVASAEHRNHTAVSAEEWREFGGWVASRAFDPDWAIPQLQAALRHQGSVESDHAVVEYLTDLVEERPWEVLETLALFDPAPAGERWRVHYWLDHAEIILRYCISDGDRALRARAEEIINRWVARGHLGLRELLSLP